MHDLFKEFNFRWLGSILISLNRLIAVSNYAGCFLIASCGDLNKTHECKIKQTYNAGNSCSVKCIDRAVRFKTCHFLK